MSVQAARVAVRDLRQVIQRERACRVGILVRMGLTAWRLLLIFIKNLIDLFVFVGVCQLFHISVKYAHCTFTWYRTTLSSRLSLFEGRAARGTAKAVRASGSGDPVVS